MMVKAYMTSYKLPCIITRGNNVYGPHQFPEKLVPKFTLLARRGEALPVHGAGQVRLPCPDAHPALLESSTPCAGAIDHILQNTLVNMHVLATQRAPPVLTPQRSESW